jgi:hypothetical protein
MGQSWNARGVSRLVQEAQEADDAQFLQACVKAVGAALSQDSILSLSLYRGLSGSMDGLKLAHAVRHRWPPIKRVVTSGRELPTEQELPAGNPVAGSGFTVSATAPARASAT